MLIHHLHFRPVCPSYPALLRVVSESFRGLFIKGFSAPGARGWLGQVLWRELSLSLNLGLNDVEKAIGLRAPLIYQLFLDHYVPASDPTAH